MVEICFSCLNKARFGMKNFGVLGATRMLDDIKDYVENRGIMFKPLASNQLIQKKLEMQIEINLGLASCLLSAKALIMKKILLTL